MGMWERYIYPYNLPKRGGGSTWGSSFMGDIPEEAIVPALPIVKTARKVLRGRNSKTKARRNPF